MPCGLEKHIRAYEHCKMLDHQGLSTYLEPMKQKCDRRAGKSRCLSRMLAVSPQPGIHEPRNNPVSKINLLAWMEGAEDRCTSFALIHPSFPSYQASDLILSYGSLFRLRYTVITIKKQKMGPIRQAGADPRTAYGKCASESTNVAMGNMIVGGQKISDGKWEMASQALGYAGEG